MIDKILSLILETSYKICSNYGIAIVIFAVIVKLILSMLEYYTRVVGIKGQIVSKEQKEITDKYRGNNEKMFEETRKLYAKYNISFLSIPLSLICTIITIVILFKVIFMVGQPLTTINKLGKEDISLKFEEIKKDYKEGTNLYSLDEYDKKFIDISEKEKLDPQTIVASVKKEGEAPLINSELFGVNTLRLPKVQFGTNSKSVFDIFKHKENTPFIVIPALYVITTIISMVVIRKDMEQMRNMVKTNDKEINVKKVESDKFTAEDFEDSLMTSNKMLTYIVPIMILLYAYIAPLTLCIYWTVSSIIDVIKNKVFAKLTKNMQEKLVKIKNTNH